MAASNALAGELIMRCFNARTVTHVLHLQTNSYAVHEALGGFYEEIIPLADSFAEVYQGLYGIIKTYPTGPAYSTTKDYKEGMVVMVELCDWIRANRKSIGSTEDTALQNIVDEIVSLVERTRYKLRFLK